MTINYDIPIDQDHRADPLTYLHRSGRSGRRNEKGITLNFVDGPTSHQNLMSIQAHWNRPIDEIKKDELEEKLTAVLKEVKTAN
jgi:ATP-dependent RNA helicase DDX19/DBP5